MYAVTTTVSVREGSVDELARIFAETNPALVASQPDWKAAWFTADRATSTVQVVAHWSDPAAYEVLRASDEFGATMAQFAEHFVGAPTVVINEILVAM